MNSAWTKWATHPQSTIWAVHRDKQKVTMAEWTFFLSRDREFRGNTCQKTMFPYQLHVPCKFSSRLTLQTNLVYRASQANLICNWHNLILLLALQTELISLKKIDYSLLECWPLQIQMNMNCLTSPLSFVQCSLSAVGSNLQLIIHNHKTHKLFMTCTV